MILVTSGLVISKILLLLANCIFCCRQKVSRHGLHLINHCQPLPTEVKHFELMNLSEVFANSWIYFIKRSCQYVTFYLHDSLLTIRDKYWWKLAAMFEKLNQQVMQKGSPFMSGAYLCVYKVWVLINAMWMLKSKKCLYSWGACFVWVHIILSLQYCNIMLPSK